MRTPAALVFTLMVAGALAGCIGGSPTDAAAPANDSPDVVTDPSNYSYARNASLDDGGHIHDYWDGRDRITLMDRTDVVNSLWLTSDLIHPFRPPGGHVVPQGTATVEVTISWETSAISHHLPPQLWIKTAADDEAWHRADLEDGRTYEVPSSMERNDLAHQQLSAWSFQFRVPNPNEPVPYEPLIFNGTVSIHVEAIRGLELPVFPGHPDPWNGSDRLPLLETTIDRFFTGNIGCYWGCQDMVHEPANGSIVPFDADVVEVVMESNETVPFPTRFGLAYHGAETRNFTRIQPDEDDGTRKVYRIPVRSGMGDGPYALQSQWRFMPYISEPVEDGATRDRYDLSARALKVT